MQHYFEIETKLDIFTAIKIIMNLPRCKAKSSLNE